jgi:hypothetical protein
MQTAGAGESWRSSSISVGTFSISGGLAGTPGRIPAMPGSETPAPSRAIRAEANREPGSPSSGKRAGVTSYRTAGMTSWARRSTCSSSPGPVGMKLKAVNPISAKLRSRSATASGDPETTEGSASAGSWTRITRL